jgi:superfamily I DNA/RNA helicase/RecB family exonuclease
VPRAELVLRRDVLSGARPPQLDPVQQQVVAHRGGPLRVLGAPGTGKTTALVEAVVDRVERDGLDPGDVLVLAPTRLAAARLRERVTARLSRTVREPLARTPQSFAFGVLRRVAAAADEPAPRLISGPEQDLVLRELLAGHVDGIGAQPAWPPELLPALATRGFRGQLRDLVMRAVERGVGPVDLAELGRNQARPEWVAAAHVLQEYLDVTALAAPGAYDPAAITGAAAAALSDDAVLLDQVRSQTRFLAFDDAHEATASVAELVRTVVGSRGDVLLTGDPDAATQGFRGADPALLVDGLGAGGGETVVRLRTAWRQGPVLREISRRVVDRIGTVGGAAHRKVSDPPSDGEAPARPAGEAEVHVLRSAVHEASFVAELLRRQHLERGVPWSQMAVVVRGTSRASTLRRVLTSGGVPVDVPPTEQPVRDQAAVVPLLDVFETALAIARGEAAALPVDRAVALLTSSLGGADAVGLRRLRRALRAQHLGAPPGPQGPGDDRPAEPQLPVVRSSDDLIVEALLDPVRLAVLDQATAAPAHRVARVLAAGVAAVRTDDDVTAETVLWAIWSASGLAEAWRRTALAGGAAGARADRDLDAVVALFDAAARFVERLPHAGPAEFVQHLRGQEVPGDTLVERGAGRDAVALVTPQGAAGLQWRVVVVCGVQEGVWPDLRLRGSLLGSEVLVDVLTGRDSSPRAALAAVRDDETRLFHVAVSRASERLVVTAVRDEDEQPSSFLDLVDPLDGRESFGEVTAGADGVRPLTPAPRPLSLPGLVARLRQALTDRSSSEGVRSRAAHELARLAAAGVPGAHPDDWHGLLPLSDDGPLATDDPVRVSPSRVEEFDRCALRWLLTTSGGRGPSSRAQELGNLVHELAAELPDADAPTLRAELHRRWSRLGLGAGWVADADRARLDAMVTKLASYIAANRGRWTLVGTELPFDVLVDLPEGPARLTGRVDRVERDEDGALRVVDLKTGKTPPSNGEVPRHAQLGVYQVAVEEGGFTDGHAAQSAGAALVHLGSSHKNVKEQPQPPLDRDPEPAWARALLARVSAGMAGAEFAATVSDLCTRCPVRASCPAQSDGRVVTQ